MICRRNCQDSDTESRTGAFVVSGPPSLVGRVPRTRAGGRRLPGNVQPGA
jgi:hypothetical protein